jgi:hypothetical protein
VGIGGGSPLNAEKVYRPEIGISSHKIGYLSDNYDSDCPLSSTRFSAFGIRQIKSI